MQISFGWSLAACKLGSLYYMAASQMHLHPDGGQQNEICILLAAD
jgi:hypothetical protein